MKTFYELLEVDKNASDETIKTVYKSLVKKYHPDLKDGQEKIQAEDQIKKINEAYDVLSDPIKRHEYDQTLTNESISQEQYASILNENINLKRELNIYRNRFNSAYGNYYQDYNHDSSDTYQSQNISQSDLNIKNIFNHLSSSIKNILTLFITLLIIFILINIPFVKSLILYLFENGMIFILIVVFILFYYFKNK